MSNKVKQIIDKLQQSNNLIQQQRKEIDKLKSMAINNIVNKYNTESEGEMTEEIIMNPDILPTLEEWRLICKMIKGSEK